MITVRNRIPFFIAILLLVLGVISTIILFQRGIGLGLSVADVVSNCIQIWICVGAFISAAYVISSYMHTNMAFALSQKPHLLLQVGDQEVQRSQENNEMVHMTVISYQNKSDNPFYDLCLSIKVSAPNTTVDLSDLFTPKMYMAARDSRTRKFSTIDELRKRDFNLNSAVEQSQQIILSLAYEFEFNKKVEKVKVQEYFWDTGGAKPHWTIR